LAEIACELAEVAARGEDRSTSENTLALIENLLANVDRSRKAVAFSLKFAAQTQLFTI
jgi:hypothetical protein